MVGRGPDPEPWSPAPVSAACGADGQPRLRGDGSPSRCGRRAGSPAARSIELARERLDETRSHGCARAPRRRRGDVQCWHGGPQQRRPRVRRRLQRERLPRRAAGRLGLVGHTHVAAAWRQTPRGAKQARIRVGEPLELADGKWLLNPGAVGAPVPPRRGLVGRPRRRTPPTAPSGCCSTSSAAPRRGGAPLRPGAGARAGAGRSGSIRDRGAQRGTAPGRGWGSASPRRNAVRLAAPVAGPERDHVCGASSAVRRRPRSGA